MKIIIYILIALFIYNHLQIKKAMDKKQVLKDL